MYNGNDVSRAEEAGSDSVLVGTAGKSCYTEVCEVFDWQRPSFVTSAYIVLVGGKRKLSRPSPLRNKPMESCTQKSMLHVASFDSLEYGLLHSFRTHPTVNIYDGDRVRGGLGLATYVCLLGLRMDRTGRDGTE